jgi:hypothetical protein
MAKTSKKIRDMAVAQSGPASEPPGANGPGKDTPVASATSKISGSKSSKTTGKSKAAAKRGTRPAGKTQRTRKSRAVTPIGQADGSRRIEFSDDDIRLRAYFIAEQRMQSGMPGDSTNDWWEAHRQLQEEASKNN